MNAREHGESSEVRWRLGPITLCGTLTSPRGDGPYPAVVMAAGSGPTDRDWNSPLLPGTNGSARLLAAALAEAGFASLRFDKSASGPQGQENARVLAGTVSMDYHVDELAGAVRRLAKESFVRRDKIFGLGNSEGTLHVLNYALREPALPFAGLVLTGPPGRSVGAVARWQLAAQAAGIPNGDALLTLYDAAIERFIAGEPAAPDPALPQGVQDLLRGLESPANLPFARELWTANATSLVAAVHVPMLILIGKKDIQVDWQADAEPLRRAAEDRTDVTFSFPENANHVLKHEPRARPELSAAEVAQRYNADDAELDAEATETILTWLRIHAT